MSTFEEILRSPQTLDEDRVLLFDGHSLAYRAYYAIRDLTAPSGEPVNAVFGFWRTVLRTLREYPSAFVAVAFDAGGITFRHEMYAEYKATRKPIPEDLAVQLPRIERLLSALGIRVFSEAGVEADDVLATLARSAASSGLQCLIVTSDKDMAQLVDDRIALLRPSGRGSSVEHQVLDPKGVCEKYGVRPGQMVDMLSLVGDVSDNVPGVPGVGEKTATRLLEEFGSLDAILSQPDCVRNERVRNSLEDHADAARLARRLITLRSDLPIGEARESCRLGPIDTDELSSFFSEVGFRSALKDLGIEASPVRPQESQHPRAPEREAEYRTVLDELTLREVIASLSEADAFALDLETTSLDPMVADIVGIAVSPSPFVGYYIPVGHDALGTPAQLALDAVLDALRPLIEGERPLIRGQNLKYDVAVLARYGIRPAGIEFDTMIASHLARPDERRHNLEQIAETYLAHRVTTYAEVAGKNGSFASVPLDAATRYAAEDAEIVQRLHAPLALALEQVGATSLFAEVEIPLITVLARMERNGILVDIDVLAEQGDELRKEIQIVEADLVEMAGGPFNPNSPKQVAEVLFERLRLPVIDRTKTGPSTSARVLSELAVHHPLPGKLMVHRELKKLLTTYIEQLPKSVHEETGRIHTSFHQASTATGRLSSSNPNLQNIPTRSEVGGRIRRAFIAPEGSALVSADYSQIELRLLAHISEDERLIDALEAGADLHRLTASHVYGIPEDHVTEVQRTTAKRINFGILYGISPYGLGRDLGVTQSEAKGFIDRFFDAYPKTRETIDRLVDQATERGYAETILGRRRPLRELGSRNVARRNFDRRNAVNTPIQGSAADVIKLAMLRIDEAIESHALAAKMLLQIHDELVFEIPQEACEGALRQIAAAMVGVLPLRVSLQVKTAVGRNWSEI
jgi:DNA polymerase-1